MDPKLRVVNVPSRVPYGLPEWRIDGGPDVEVAALLSRTDEGDRPVRKGYATCPGEVMEVTVTTPRALHCGGLMLLLQCSYSTTSLVAPFFPDWVDLLCCRYCVSHCQRCLGKPTHQPRFAWTNGSILPMLWRRW